MSANQDDETRAVDDEVSLLQSMYPDEVSWLHTSSELTFKNSDGTLRLRVPSDYPSNSSPTVIAATGPRNHDVRTAVKKTIDSQQLGEPCLDAIISEYIDLIESLKTTEETHAETQMDEPDRGAGKTVVIWLHHLLATGKRKLALAPSSSISGITKPGYPGVMVFTGPAGEVGAHVQELKSQRWQAFQVRYEGDEIWSFGHGHGIVEVETLGEVVADVEANKEQREAFMSAMKIK